MVTTPRRPSRLLYLLAVLIVVAGFVAFALLLVTPFRGMQRILMPGSQTVELTQSGTYTLYYEYQGTLQGVHYDASSDPPMLQVVIRNMATGEIFLTTHVSSNTSRYATLSRSGKSYARFNVDQPGSYQITATYPDGTSGPQFALAIAHGPFGGLAGGIMLAVAVLLIGIGIGLAVGLVVYFKRNQTPSLPARGSPTPA